MANLKKTDIPQLIMLIRTNFENAYNFQSEEEGRLLIAYWYDTLKDYPREVVFQSVSNAIKTSDFAPKIKNILDEVDKLVNANKKTDEELWAELVSVLYETHDASCDLRYGDESYRRGTAKLSKIWSELSEEIKAYCVNISGLREIAAMDNESRVFEKGRFLKAMPRIKETLKNRQASEQFLKLAGANGLTLLLGNKKGRKLMNIGLFDVDSHNFPNLPLMKISAWHKARGDSVEFVLPLKHYDKIYVSKVFGDEYSEMPISCLQADEIVYGGTGFAITVENGKEVYHKDRDPVLPDEIEHIYPDYSLYPELTKDTAYGFLTRGCCNNCDFCIVSKKEGICSQKVADLSEFWKGQKNIELLDANLLACKDRMELLQQLADSKANVNFNQGLDARFITREVADLLKKIKAKRTHFAFDFMKNEKAIIKGLSVYKEIVGGGDSKQIVYILTNFNTTIEQDLYRVQAVRKLGFLPDIRIYRKNTAPQIIRDLQRWCNNRILFRTCEFMDYVPRKDGKTIREIYFNKENL